jgi:hypothetical protein
MTSEPALTFDEELLSWLGDEPASVRQADAERIRQIAAELAHGFDQLADIGPAVTVFGSARTPLSHPNYALVREVGATLGRAAVLADRRVDEGDLRSLTIATSPGEVVQIIGAARERGLAERPPLSPASNRCCSEATHTRCCSERTEP